MDFECLNHSNITFGMSQANCINFNTESQYEVKFFGLLKYPKNKVSMRWNKKSKKMNT